VASATTSPAQLAEEIDNQLAAEINEAQLFYRQDKDGNSLELKLVTADTQEYRKAAGLIAGAWQEIGVKTSIQYFNPKDFSRSVLKGRDYDILLYGMILGSDPDQFPFWHSTQVAFPGLNLAGYANRNADGKLGEFYSRAGSTPIQIQGADTGGSQDLPIAIIVGPDTEGSPEIFAAALQASKRATVVGLQTPGKIFGYTTVPLPDGSNLTFASQSYKTSKGQDLAELGVEPDIVVEADWDEVSVESDPAIEKAVELLE
jgi:hypothetical protein